MSRSSRATVELILTSARDALISHGYAKFTTRLVAEFAGISPGNLSYHYPSKQSLLQALVHRMLADYVSEFEAVLADTGQNFDQGLSQIVRLIMLDSVEEVTVRSFREIWAIAIHDEVVCEAVDDMYDQLMDRVADLLHRLCPQSDLSAIRESVQLLALVSEGTAVLYGTRMRRAVSHEQIIAIITRVLGSHVGSGSRERPRMPVTPESAQ